MARKRSCTLRTTSDGVPHLEFRGKYVANDWGLEVGSKLQLIYHDDNQIILKMVEIDICRKNKQIYSIGRVPQVMKNEPLPRLSIQGHFLVRKFGFQLGDKFHATQEVDYIVLTKIPTITVQYEQALQNLKSVQREMRVCEQRVQYFATQLQGGNT